MVCNTIFLFGSEDHGAVNYFNTLFENCSFRRIQFFNLCELEDFHNANKDHYVVLTGSSLGDDTLDKNAINFCNNNNVLSCSVIEHWSWYLERFRTSKGFVFPNKILLNDDIAKKEALKSGIPKSKIEVLGNPVLESLSRQGTHRKNLIQNQLLSKYNIPNNKKSVLFISEQLTEFRQGNTDLLGYDEFTTFDIIHSIFMNLGYHIIIKSHPTESERKYGQHSYIRSISVNELAKIPDVVIGMGSMLLLELAMFRDDVISFRPNSKTSFIGKKLGAVISVTDRNRLIPSISRKAENIDTFRKHFLGSRKQILSYLSILKQ